MFAFGDAPRPLTASAALVEEIVHVQVNQACYESHIVTIMAFMGAIEVQGGPSALGKKYVDTKFEVAFSCKFIPDPGHQRNLEIDISQHISFPKQMGHPVIVMRS